MLNGGGENWNEREEVSELWSMLDWVIEELWEIFRDDGRLRV